MFIINSALASLFCPYFSLFPYLLLSPLSLASKSSITALIPLDFVMCHIFDTNLFIVTCVFPTFSA